MPHFNYLPDWPWLAGAGLLVAALLFVSYYLAVGKPKWWLRVCLLALRWVAIASVVVCLLDPQRVEETRHSQTSQVALLVDNSRSMSIKDVPEGRLGSAKNWLRQQLLPVWPANVTRSSYTFGQSLESIPQIDNASPTGGVTALAGALQHLLALPGEQPLAGVILCSDGNENANGDALAVARLFRRKGIPIYTATFGSTEEPRDIVVENVQVKPAVPNEAPTRIALTLRAPGFTNQMVPIQIRHGNRVVATQQVRLTGGEQRVEMDFTPREKGFQTYEASIPAQPGEWLASNNRRLFGLEVIDPTIRVIYMEGTPQQPGAPMPEWKYLKDALESDPHIKVKVLYQLLSQNSEGGQRRHTVDVDPESGDKAYPVNHPTRGFPRTMADLLNYDVVIHSDIKVQSFSDEQLQNIARLVEQSGGGFIMIGGNSAFGKGGYQKTVLDRIIPVAMQQYADSVKMLFQMQSPSSAFEHPVMAIGATREETRKIWTEKFPCFYGFNRVDRPKPGAIVLGVTPPAANPGAYAQGYAGKVVLAVQEIGKGRSMAFTSDTTRSWGVGFETLWGERLNPSLPLTEANCDARYYRSFWINAIRWLGAGKIGKTNNAVTLEMSQSYSLPNQPATARIKVRDDALREISGAAVSLILSTGRGNAFTNRATFDPATLSYGAELRPAVAGNYTVTASATLNGQKLGDDQQLLVCEAVDPEMLDVRAKPEIMAGIARASGGKALPVDAKNPPSLSSIFGGAPPATISYHHTPLWDKPWWLAGILGLLTLEWVVRRLRGMA